MSPISFTNVDFQGVDPYQDDPIIVIIELENIFHEKGAY